LVTCWLNTWLSRFWMVDDDIDGSNTDTFGPRSGLVTGGPLGGVVGGVVGGLPPACVHRWFAVPAHAQICRAAPLAVLLSRTSRHLPLARLTSAPVAFSVHFWVATVS
jgi:hypothetical protein